MAYWRITDLGEYILRGPLVMYSPDDPDGECLVPDLRLTKMYVQVRPEETINLFVPAAESRPANMWPVVRRLTWDRRSDIKKRSQLRWPTLSIDFYQVEPVDYPHLDAALRQVDEALSRLTFQSRGLEVADLYEERPDEEIPNPPYNYEAILCRRLQRQVNGLSLDINLYGHFDELSNAWDGLWQTLVSVCQPSRRLEGCKEDYGLDLEKYADFLGRPPLDDL